jgi:hypothetical protein
MEVNVFLHQEMVDIHLFYGSANGNNKETKQLPRNGNFQIDILTTQTYHEMFILNAWGKQQ